MLNARSVEREEMIEDKTTEFGRCLFHILDLLEGVPIDYTIQRTREDAITVIARPDVSTYWEIEFLDEKEHGFSMELEIVGGDEHGEYWCESPAQIKEVVEKHILEVVASHGGEGQ